MLKNNQTIKTLESKNKLQGSRENLAIKKFSSSYSIHYYTPDYKGLQVELEATEKCYTSFLSLKHPDFKNVIFKILEISLCDSLARQHSRSGLIHPDLGRISCGSATWMVKRLQLPLGF